MREPNPEYLIFFVYFSLMQHLTLFTDDPDGEYPNQDVVWEKFEKAFIAAAGLITHAPVLRDYYYKGLGELQLDNIMYLELRSGLSRVCVCSFVHTTPPAPAIFKCYNLKSRPVFQTYELDGTIHDKGWCLKTFQEVTKKFIEDHPDFLGARIIISVHR